MKGIKQFFGAISSTGRILVGALIGGILLTVFAAFYLLPLC